MIFTPVFKLTTGEHPGQHSLCTLPQFFPRPDTFTQLKYCPQCSLAKLFALSLSAQHNAELSAEDSPFCGKELEGHDTHALTP